MDTDKAEATAKDARRAFVLTRKLKERIQELHDQLANSRKELRVEPEHVQQVVETALELAGQPALRPTKLAGVPLQPRCSMCQSCGHPGIAALKGLRTRTRRRCDR